MADFDKAVITVLKHEGGYVDNPNDPGGATRYGISQEMLTEEKIPFKPEEITIPIAKRLYKERYWDRMNLQDIESQELATILLDMGVLMGPYSVVKTLQGVLNVSQDGVIGPKTIEQSNRAMSSSYSRMLLTGLIKSLQIHFIRLVRDNPKLMEFLEGWIRRTHSLLDLTCS